MLTGVVHSFENLVVQQDGTALVVAGGEKLDHLPPPTLILRFQEVFSAVVQIGNDVL